MNENTESAIKIFNSYLRKMGCDDEASRYWSANAVDDIHKEMQRYNGYPNSETYSMDLWLSNDRAKHDIITKEIIPDCKREAPSSHNVREKIWIEEEAIQFCVADRIQDMVEREKPEVEDVWSAFINTSLGQVD